MRLRASGLRFSMAGRVCRSSGSRQRRHVKWLNRAWGPRFEPAPCWRTTSLPTTVRAAARRGDGKVAVGERDGVASADPQVGGQGGKGVKPSQPFSWPQQAQRR